MAKVFISYRRDDTQYQADKLYDLIKPRVADPERDIFIDVDNIPLGVDFVDHLGERVSQCDIMLALIGKNWMGVTNPKLQQARIQEKDDFVRIEVAQALERNIRVIPVMFDGAQLPSESELPDDLKKLVRRNGIPIARASFEHDVNRLLTGLGINEIEQAPAPVVAPPKPPETKPKVDKFEKTVQEKPTKSKTSLILSALAVLLSVGVGYFVWSSGVLTSLNRSDPVEVVVKTPKKQDPFADLTDESVPGSAPDFSGIEETIVSKEPPIDPAVAAELLKRKEMLTRLQSAMNGLELYKGANDGVLGPATLRAVAMFEKQYGIRSPNLETASLQDIRDFTVQAEKAHMEKISDVDFDRPATEEKTAPPAMFLTAAKPVEYPVGKSFTDCSGCPEMVVVPSGSFKMGSPSSEPDRYDHEGQQRTVRIGYKFAVGKYEVTWAQWEACVSAGSCNGSGPQSEGGDQGWGKGSRPVINVNWNDAKAYAKWLSGKTGHTYRLLSEAEWEYAARAGTTTPFSTGQRITTSQANFFGHSTYNGSSKGTYRKKTLPVGSFSANAFGLYDMHGNVIEWVEDWYKSSYSHAPSNGRPFTNCSSCSKRVYRGGSWGYIPTDLRSAYRGKNTPSIRTSHIGFRLARDL